MFALFLDETMTYSAACSSVGSPDRITAGGAGGPAGAPRGTSWPRPSAARSTGSSIGGRGAGHPGAGDRHRAGVSWLSGRPARAPPAMTISPSSSDLALRRWPPPAPARQVDVELLTTGQVEGGVRRHRVRRDGRGGRPGATGRTTSAALDRLLAPGGRIGLQSITMPHGRMLATRDTQTWILKYIFPGGLIPSVTAIAGERARAQQAWRARAPEFGLHYAETLQIWRDRLRGRARPAGPGSASTRVPPDVAALPVLLRGRVPGRATSRSRSSGCPPPPPPPLQPGESMPGPRARRARTAGPAPATRGGGGLLASRWAEPVRRRAAGCASGPGTAARPGPATARRWSCAAGRPCAGCSGTRASSAWPRRT